MLDVWGDPVTIKTTPAGHRARVALGTGCACDGGGRDDVWEMRVTDPDDDLAMVHCWMVHPDTPAEVTRMRVDPERYWATAEATLMVNYDAEVAFIARLETPTT